MGDVAVSREMTWKREIRRSLFAVLKPEKAAPEDTGHMEQPRQEAAQTMYAAEEPGNQPPERKEEREMDAQSGNSLFSRNNQDKVVLDLIASAENIIKDRQLIHCENAETNEQLQAANDTIRRLKQDLFTIDGKRN